MTLEGVCEMLSKPDRAEQAFGLCEAGSGVGDPAEAERSQAEIEEREPLPLRRSARAVVVEDVGPQRDGGCMIARVEGDRAEVHLGHELVPFSTEGTGHVAALLEVAARPFVVAFGLGDEPEHRMAGKRDCSFAALFGGLEAECGELAGANQVALAPGDPGTAAIGVGPKPRRDFGRRAR